MILFTSIGWTRLHTVFDIAVLESLITCFFLLLRCGELESCGRRQLWNVGHFCKIMMRSEVKGKDGSWMFLSCF
jgi:hypothetical protein